jgi:primosomal protein N' (replication factor Y)
VFIIDVIPLTKIPLNRSQIYTYFYPQKISVGILVMVSLYRRKVLGLVINVQNLEKRKIEIKNYSYQLKKIEKIISSKQVLTKKQLELARWMSDYYRAPISLIIKMIAPPILKREKKIIQLKKVKLKFKKTPKLNSQEKKIISNIQKAKEKIILIKNNFDEIHKIYPKIIESVIKKNGQVFVLSPEIFESGQTKEFLKNYFDESIIGFFHYKTSKGKFLQIYKKIRQGTIKIIVGANLSAFAPFKNLKLIIINQEENSNYKNQEKFPYYNNRDIALKLSKIFKAKTILISETPSIESFYKASLCHSRSFCHSREGGNLILQKNKYKLIELKVESKKPIADLISMKKEIRKGNFSVFSDALLENLEKNIIEKKKSLLFVSRRGAATFIVCRDCGYLIKCPNCDAPMIFHYSKTKNYLENEILICHHCNFRAATPLFCPKCKGHRIKYSGIGSQKVEQELKKKFPQAKIVRLDSDTAKNLKEKNKIYQDFKNNKIDILIATQIILGNKNLDKINFTGAMSLDTILHLPDFRSAERTFHIIYQLIKMSDNFILQTYSARNFAFQSAVKMNYEKFYEKEIKDRKALFYPPFSKLVKLTCFDSNQTTGKTKTEKITDLIIQRKKELNVNDKDLIILGPAPAFIARVRSQWKWNIILKINPALLEKRWIEKNGQNIKDELLKLVPQNWRIDIDPENLL